MRCWKSVILSADSIRYPPPPIPLDGDSTTLIAVTIFSKKYSKSPRKRRQPHDLETWRSQYASTTLLLRPHHYNEDLTTLSLRWTRCSCDLATTLAMELRFRCAFVTFLKRIWYSDTLLLRPVRFYCALAVSATMYDSCHFDQISNRSGIAAQWNWGGVYRATTWLSHQEQAFQCVYWNLRMSIRAEHFSCDIISIWVYGVWQSVKWKY